MPGHRHRGAVAGRVHLPGLRWRPAQPGEEPRPVPMHRRRQTSPIAGTIFASTKLPLRTWFRAMYHMTQSKQGISSIELGRRLGVTQTTAWTVKHKLKQVMMERDAGKRLTGRIEIDDVYLGGERRGGKRGRGAPGKTPFVAAVETTPEASRCA
jgi:ISXO2 transposase-like protein